MLYAASGFVLLSNNADEMPAISLGHLIELDKHMRNLFMGFAMNSENLVNISTFIVIMLGCTKLYNYQLLLHV